MEKIDSIHICRWYGSFFCNLLYLNVNVSILLFEVLIKFQFINFDHIAIIAMTISILFLIIIIRKIFILIVGSDFERIKLVDDMPKPENMTEKKDVRFGISKIQNLNKSYMTSILNGEIWLFSDKGSDPYSVVQLFHCLLKVVDSSKHKIFQINTSILLEYLPTLLSNGRIPTLIIFPGGYDTGFKESLGLVGCTILQEYLKKGGNYLGLCAGGYFGCSEIMFGKGNKDMEIHEKRHLNLIDGIVGCGPVLADYNYVINAGARVIQIHIKNENKYVWTYYNGGCHFYLKQDLIGKQSYDCLASYHFTDAKKDVVEYATNHMQQCDCKHHRSPNDLCAIVGGRFGHGYFVLSGVHLEFDPLLMDVHDKHLTSVIRQLSDPFVRQQRLHVVTQILSKLGIEHFAQSEARENRNICKFFNYLYLLLLFFFFEILVSIYFKIKHNSF
ncbi:biotin-protein ligase [Reticulomyxa filosa]|uniref:Biotin-protein ligase n=1 Tax=Reticulomyxa filosa TaxID=46433 RepID=X6M5W0_RETFI|nr:biotin-protein ligase [Reticulomyxa filosa]|eukprot:ETO08857.1 biotin-protein ligase [Reticulomyxa filosa]